MNHKNIDASVRGSCADVWACPESDGGAFRRHAWTVIDPKPRSAEFNQNRANEIRAFISCGVQHWSFFVPYLSGGPWY